MSACLAVHGLGNSTIAFILFARRVISLFNTSKPRNETFYLKDMHLNCLAISFTLRSASMASCSRGLRSFNGEKYCWIRQVHCALNISIFPASRMTSNHNLVLKWFQFLFCSFIGRCRLQRCARHDLCGYKEGIGY